MLLKLVSSVEEIIEVSWRISIAKGFGKGLTRKRNESLGVGNAIEEVTDTLLELSA